MLCKIPNSQNPKQLLRNKQEQVRGGGARAETRKPELMTQIDEAKRQNSNTNVPETQPSQDPNRGGIWTEVENSDKHENKSRRTKHINDREKNWTCSETQRTIRNQQIRTLWGWQRTFSGTWSRWSSGPCSWPSAGPSCLTELHVGFHF